jgi:hypothetical protein
MDAGTLERDLGVLGRYYHTKSVRLLGGEPLLHPDLAGLISVVRRSGITDSICIVTNGLLLPRMDLDLWMSVNRVEVSQYPGRELSDERRQECEERAQACGTEIQFTAYSDFRQSYSEQGTTDSSLSRAIFDSCAVVHDWRCHTLANGRFYKCPQAYYLPQVVQGCAGNDPIDSIQIDDSRSFGDALLSYLESQEPLQTCGHCLGTAGVRLAHVQIRRKEFRAFQSHPAEELVDSELLSHSYLPLRTMDSSGSA